MDNYSLSDVAAVTGNNNDNLAGGGFFWIFALLVLAGGGGIGGLGGKGTAEVTGYQLGELSGRVADKDSIATLQNSTNQGFSGLNTIVQQGFSSSTFEVVNRISALSAQVAQCCCDIKTALCEGFGQVRFDMAQGFSRLESKMDGQTIQAQNDRIRQLELNAATCNVVRFPSQITYGAGGWPPHGCGY